MNALGKNGKVDAMREYRSEQRARRQRLRENLNRFARLCGWRDAVAMRLGVERARRALGCA